jgi:hypothetical protein
VKGFKRWGSAKDMIPWKLGKLEQRVEYRPWKDSRDPGVLIAVT